MNNMTTLDDNPLLQPWTTPYGLPPFAAIRPEHFVPAFDRALASHLAEIDAITATQEPPTFANTLVAFDRSGRSLDRIAKVFHNLAASETSPALQAVERAMSPRLAAHRSAIYLNAALFARIDDLHLRRGELSLNAEQLKLLQRVHFDFERAGAALSAGRQGAAGGHLRAARHAGNGLLPERPGRRSELRASLVRREGPCGPARGCPRRRARRGPAARREGGGAHHLVALADRTFPYLLGTA